MNTSLRAIAMLLLLAALAIPATAQITITKDDVVGALLNKTSIKNTDSVTSSINLGNGTAGQSWDFTAMTFTSGHVRRDTSENISPAGLPGASDFPTAASGGFGNAIGIVANKDTVFKLDLASFASVEDDGVYLLGYAFHMYFSPARPAYAPWTSYPKDTLVTQAWRPKALGIPLPMTYNGGVRNSVDTSMDPTLLTSKPKTTVITHSFTMAGEGTIHLPGGESFQAIRIIHDFVKVETATGSYKRTRTKRVLFYGKSGGSLEFDVDTLYLSGSTTPFTWTVSHSTNSTTDVRRNSDATPERFALNQNYPNPFNPSTVISFDVRNEGFVSLKVFNVVGQEVATLAEGQYAPGTYSARFDATNLPSGVYMYRLTGNGVSVTKSMLLVR